MRGCSGGRAALLLHGRPRHKQLASLGWSPSFAWGSSSSSTGPGPLFFSPQLAGSTTNSLFLFSPQSRLFCSTTSSSQDEPQPQREERLSKPPPQREERLSKPPVRPRSAPRPPVPPAPLKLKAKRRRGAATSARKQEQSERKKEAEEHEEENTAQTKQGQGSTSSEVERMPELDAKQYDSAVVYYFTRAKVVVGQVLTHYWNGTKLLYNNITLSRRLVQMQRDGQPISRRDHKLVSRTKKDVKTAIPFLLLLLAPFSAYYLPFIIGFFPRILPSTYLHSSHKEDYQQKQLERRLQLAQRFFLVDSLANKLSSKEEATGIIDAFERCTTEKKEALLSHKPDQTEEENNGQCCSMLVSLFPLVEQKLPLEGFTKEELDALLSYFDIWVIPFITSDATKRQKFIAFLENLREDDARILAEEGGLTSLTTEELVEACEERGLRARHLSAHDMQTQLSVWLQVSAHPPRQPAALFPFLASFLSTHHTSSS